MAPSDLAFSKLSQSSFGIEGAWPGALSHAERIKVLMENSDKLRAELNAAGGLMLIKGMADFQQAPEQLIQLSGIFGSEIEDYYKTPTAKRFLHDNTPEILVLSNLPPCDHPPPRRPDPAYTEEGELVVSYPHQTNWHTDQSYRRPPPDVTLLLGLITPPKDQGQTLFADCTGAYAALSDDMKAHISGLSGIHAPGWIGRREEDVRAGVVPKTVMSHQQPQRQPLVRTHPETQKPALYICEERQMDFVDGPIDGLVSGPDGAGADLLRALLKHATQPEFTYAHHWEPGDLVVADNRCLLHAATWYDADQHARLMWRTTVSGNPGDSYRDEAKSWLAKEGVAADHGMETS